MPRTFARTRLTVTITVLAIAFGAFAEEAKNLLKPTNKPDSWRLEQHDTAKGTMAAADDAILFDITQPDGTEWHVQGTQAGLDLKDGKEYIISFKGKASSDRPVQLNAMIDQNDWHTIGLSEAVDFTKDWKEYKYEFKAEQTVVGKNRISFMLGGEKGQVWIKELTLTQKP